MESGQVNSFVVTVTLLVGSFSFIAGLLTGSMNGVLEMDGFKSTFRHLYNGNSSEMVDSSGYSIPLNASTGNGEWADASSRCSSGGSGSTSAFLIGFVVSSSNLGAFVGSLAGGWLADCFSRKYTLLISGAIVAVGASFIVSSIYVWMLFLGQFLSGIANGVTLMIMSVYISEMSPKERRGMLVSTIGPIFGCGLLAAWSMNVGFSKFHLGWRVPYAIIALLGVAYFIGMLYAPHTPRWLVKRGRHKEALAVLTRINRCGHEETYFVETCLELKELQMKTTANSELTYSQILKEIFFWKYRLALTASLYFYGAVVSSVILFYMASFFCEVGIEPFYASLVVGVLLLVASIMSTLVIDRVGRKPLFLACTVFCAAITLTIAILVQLDRQNYLVQYSVVGLSGLLAFGFSASWLTLPWVVGSEIFPVNIKGATVAILSGTFWLSAFLINQLTPLIVGSSLQLHGYFYIIVGVYMSAFLVVLFLLPETKGVSLEEMNTLFAQSVCQRFMTYMRCNPTLDASADLEQQQDLKKKEDLCMDTKM